MRFHRILLASVLGLSLASCGGGGGGGDGGGSVGGGGGGTSPLANVDLVFVKSTGDLAGMKADGTGKVVLKRAGVFDAYDSFRHMSFPSAGNKMVYAAACGAFGFIRVVGSDLGNPTNLTPVCTATANQPAFSPDGSKIAFIASNWTADELGDYLYIMDADGKNPRRVSPLYGTFNPNEQSPSFTSDGTRIVFTTHRGNGSELAIIGVDGTGMQRFGGGVYLNDPVVFEATVDWKTDTIYYGASQVNTLNNMVNLYSSSLTGGNKQGPLTNSSTHSLHRPSVSPDGSKVVFNEVVNFSEANVKILDLATSNVTTLTNPAFSAYDDYPVFVRR